MCVPVRDGAGIVRGVCGMELSELYFSLSHPTVSSPYGNFLMLLAPMNGETLLLDRAMLGSTEGTDLSASGEMRIRTGRDYDTFTWNGTNGLPVSHRIDIPLFSRYTNLRLFFAQGGLDMHSIRFRLVSTEL